MGPEGSFPHSQVPSTCPYCTFFFNLLHHPRHVSNRWVHHQGLTYTSIRFVWLSLWYTTTVSHFTVSERPLFKESINDRVPDEKLQKKPTAI
jgi:hypothetical protein